MSSPCSLVYVSCGSTEQAQRIATAVVEGQLAACVSVIGPVQSVYRWEGAIQTGSEYLLMIKTTESCLSSLQKTVTELHTYNLPEFIVVPVSGGSPDYLHWVVENTRQS